MLDLSLAVHFWRLWLVDNAYKKQQYKNILNVFTLFWSLNMNPSNFDVQRSNDWADSFGLKPNLNLNQIVFSRWYHFCCSSAPQFESQLN